MSFSNQKMPLNSNSSFDERRWVIHITQTLEDELEEESETPVSIFNVPKALMASDPDCFVPQVIAIGPYHYWNSELYEMQRYKLAAAKRTQKKLQTIKFQHLVNQLTRFEPKIRACYHKYLDFSGETLGWMMAVDACFLLEFLQTYADNFEGKLLARLPSRMSHLIDTNGRKSAHNAILRDIVKLENQIPLFLLRKMFEFQTPSVELADKILLSMLMGFCKELSPFEIFDDFSSFQIIGTSAHLLDFLYNIIVPRLDEASEINEIEEEKDEKEKGKHPVSNIFSKLKKAPIHVISRIIFSTLKAMLQLPWSIISNLPVLRIFKEPVESLLCGQDTEDPKPETGDSSGDKSINKPPLLEEIAIPSVVELAEAGIKFLPTTAGISSISFDNTAVTFYLPTIFLDVNSDVVLRNLVAYEACHAPGPLILARYVELMNGIIDTEEDAKFLRERGIILNRLKSDEEVANLWNGMSKSVKLTKVPFLDDVIEDVNKYYNGRWKVRVRRFLKVYVYGSWRILTLIAAILLLLLMTLQALCSVYSCPRIFHTINSSL